MRLINEILQGIRLVKLRAWEELFEKKIGTTRNRELKLLDKDSLFWTFISRFCNSKFKCKIYFHFLLLFKMKYYVIINLELSCFEFISIVSLIFFQIQPFSRTLLPYLQPSSHLEFTSGWRNEILMLEVSSPASLFSPN